MGIRNGGICICIQISPPQVQITRVRPPGVRLTTHSSAAAADYVFPSYCSGAHDGLATLWPGREAHLPTFCQQWLIHREQRSNRKGARSQWQRWNCEWLVWPQGAGPSFSAPVGDIHVQIPPSLVGIHPGVAVIPITNAFPFLSQFVCDCKHEIIVILN